jgi:hypothetical protein
MSSLNACEGSGSWDGLEPNRESRIALRRKYCKRMTYILFTLGHENKEVQSRGIIVIKCGVCNKHILSFSFSWCVF